MRTNRMQWIGAAVLVLGIAGAPHAQQPPREGQSTTGAAADMSARCKTMMASHEKMMAEMKASDGQLQEMVAKMQQATGQAKVDAVAAVVTELVSQRTAMRERMLQMHQQRMSHMGEHMQAGAASMKGCPMMKMGGMQH